MSKHIAFRPVPCGAAARRLRLRPIALALALACGAVELQAQVLPRGAAVVQGQAAIVTQGNRMTVTNSAGAVLNWQSFSIGAGASVQFNQPSASSSVLNRVVGSDPSAILGSLSSNGQVWLLNPYGVLFGRDARVDVAGLVASTLAISDADWRAQRLGLTASPQTQAANAGITNQGELRTTNGGRVLLIGGAGGVANSGLIEAPDGQIVLAAGRSVDLADDSLPGVAVRVAAPAGQALNLGGLTVGGGRVDLQAAIVNQQGIVRAESVSGHGGTIELRAADALTTGAASLTSANGTSGGTLVADAADGTALLAGALQARGSAGAGGSATLLGRQVALLAGAAVDVSGAAGGGNVRVGGGLQGKDASAHNAQAVYFDATAGISADAGVQGRGGSVVLWSDQATRAYGTLSARGGPAGGDGGFIETSGGWLDARPRAVHADAPRGQPGKWLLDPNDLTISDVVGDANISAGPNFDTTGDSAFLNTATINRVLNGGSNVTISTQNQISPPSVQHGDITVSGATIDYTGATPVSLTLNANRNISVSLSTIKSSGGPLGVTLMAAGDGAGTISIANTSISTAGGNVLLSGPTQYISGPNLQVSRPGAIGYDGNGVGVSIAGSTIDAGGGGIKIEGNSIAANGVSGLAQGVAIGTNAALLAHHITLTGWVDTQGSLNRIGVYVAADAAVSANEANALGAPNALTIAGTASSSTAVLPANPLEGARIAGALALGGGAATISGSLNNQVQIPAGAWGVNLAQGLDLSGAQTATITGSPSLQGGTNSTYNFVASSGGATSLVASGGGASLALNWGQISGSPSALTLNASGTNSGVAINGTFVAGAFPLAVIAAGEGSAVNLNNPTINASTVTLSGNTIQGAGSIAAGDFSVHAFNFTPGNNGSALTVTASGPIVIAADSVTLAAGTTLTSNASGDAIVFAGTQVNPVNNVATFINQAGSGALSAPNGRWQVFATDPTDAVNFNGGGLSYDAVVYNATPAGVLNYGAAAATDRQFLFSVAPALSFVAGGAPIVKIYDASRAINPTPSGQVSGLINGDQLDGRFADKNAGNNKTIAVFYGSGATAIATDASGKPVYGYRAPETGAFTLLGAVTPAPLSVSGVTANGKVYDATTAATLNTAAASVAPLGADAVTLLSAGASGSFLDKNVGNAKPVSAGGFALGGADAGNYTVAQPSGLSANITPAPLYYVATPAVRFTGQPLAGFGGSVSGFVGSDTPANATSGTLQFASLQANAASPPGSYDLTGSGLAAQNYALAQAPGNATALTILQASNTSIVNDTRPLPPLIPPGFSAPTAGRTLDAMQALDFGSGSASFGSLDLANLSPDTIATLLDARDRYMASVFAQALDELARDPTLADAGTCASAAQAAAGTCLLTGQIKQEIIDSRARVAAAPAPAAVPAPAPVAPAAAPGPAPAAAPLPTVVAAPPLLFAPRSVREAALPQIQRKLAVFIGNDDFTDKRIPRLDNASADAQAMAQVFGRSLGYETLVLRDATRATILGTLNRLATEAGPRDSVVVYYAGHGQVVDKTGLGYWVPADADATKPQTWISNTDIDRLLGQISASQVALISDSCYSGSLVSPQRIGVAPPSLNPLDVLGLRTAVAMSSGGNEPVSDAGKQGHSLFAWSLMQSLQKVSTWRPGGNVFEQVRFAVARELPQRPRYGAASPSGYAPGTDYLFEQRQLGAGSP